MTKLCLCSPSERHWRNNIGVLCDPWEMEEARTWHCDRCGEIFPIGPSVDDPAEWMAFAFLEGAFDSRPSGFPTTAFHDGYRNYNERMESWITGYPEDVVWINRKLAEYAAGAFSRELSPIWNAIQPSKKVIK